MITTILTFFLFAPGPIPAEINIEGECFYGKIEQVNRTVTISGNDSWEANGRIRNDGLVELRWLELESGKIANGLYKIVDSQLIGNWGYETECAFESGDLCGNITVEILTIERKKQ